MANYLIDQTPLYAIKYDLKKQAIHGDAVLGLLKIGDDNGFASLIPGGLRGGWQSRRQNDPSTGLMTRNFDVLILAPVTVEICAQVVALQINGKVYTVLGQTPDDGSTPSQWIYQVEYTQSAGVAL